MKFKNQGFYKLISFALDFTFPYTIIRLISVFYNKTEIQNKIHVYKKTLKKRLYLKENYVIINYV